MLKKRDLIDQAIVVFSEICHHLHHLSRKIGGLFYNESNMAKKLFFDRVLCALGPVLAQGLYRKIDWNDFPKEKERFCDQSVYVLEVDPRRFDFQAVKALDRGIGRMSVRELGALHQAKAAVNGGFFAIGGTYDGCARGALKIHRWYALPFQRRAAIGWSVGDRVPKIDRLWVRLEGTCSEKTFAVHGLNRDRKSGEAVLFSPLFHHRTLTGAEGEDLIIREGKIVGIQSGGNALIPSDGYVLSFHQDHPLCDRFKCGQDIAFSFVCEPQTGVTLPEEWEKCQFIVAGTPLLVQNKKKIVDFSKERTRTSFLVDRHARMAIGILPNGNWLFVAVDRTDQCLGMTMVELRDLMADVFH